MRLPVQATLASTLALAALSAGCGDPQPIAQNSAAASAQSEKTSGVDAARCYEHVRKLVELGPRPSGSPAIKKTQDYISGELKSYGLKVTEDSFTGATPRGGIPMKNLTGELPGESGDIVIIAGHYDTKLLPGFVGANDGGSSTAGVLEMARVLSATRPAVTLWFVFFDGEEAVIDWEANNGLDNTYGSRHMAARLAKESRLSRIKAMVLVDMIGDKQLDLRKDSYSTSWLVELIWAKARETGHGRHFLGNPGGYLDDHIPFVEKGIAAVDIIDFNFGPGNSYWHTTQDSLDKVSGDSIKTVCDVVIQSLPEIINVASRRSAATQRPSQ
jgi:hypothetical protein